MALGTLNVEVGANFARFQSDMGKVVSAAQDSAARMDKAFGIVSTGLKSIGAGLAIGLTLDKVRDKIEGAIEAAAGLKEIAERTGATVEGLSSLAATARLSGTDTDALATGLQKLSKSLVDAKDGGQKTGAAFEAIGIATKELVGLKPDEAFLLISNRLATYADGAEKTAIAQALLGKAGANLLPVMNDLAVVGQFQTKVTEEQAEQALEYEKNLKRLDAAQGAIFKTIALELIPVLNAFSQALLDSATSSGGLKGAVGDLAKDGSIREWAEDAVKVVGFVVDAFQGVVRTVQLVGTYLGGTLAALDVIINGKYKDIGANLAKLRENVKSDLDEIASKALFSEALAKRLDAARKPAEKVAAARPAIDFHPITGGGQDDPSKLDLIGDLKKLDAQIEAEKKLLATRQQALDFYHGLEFVSTREAETIRQSLIADSIARELASYDAEIAAIKQHQENTTTAKDDAEDENRLNEVRAKRIAAETAASEASSQSSQKITAVTENFNRANAERQRQSDLANETTRFQIGLLGQSTLAIEQANVVRGIQLQLEEQIRQVQLQDKTVDVSGAIANAERQKAAALDLVQQSYTKQRSAAFGAQEAFRKYAEDAGNYASQVDNLLSNAFKNAEDALVTFTKTGKLNFTQLADSIITDLIRIQIKAALSGGGGSGGGLLGSLVAGFFGRGDPTGAGDSAGGVSGSAPDVSNVVYSAATGTNYVPEDGMHYILHKGEAVVPAAYNPSNGAGGNGPGVTVNIANHGAPVQAQSTQRQTDQGTVIDLVLHAVAADIKQGGKTHDAIQGRFGLNPGGSTPRY